ncbi:MAG: hypothetical protein MI919_28065 [Holophagales bacterium]|nr:hypothetical protein [Holophagales bacterium]
MKADLVRALVTVTAVFELALGLTLLFLPEELAGLLFPAQPPPETTFTGLLAATLIAHGVMSWIGRNAVLGGIYGRAIVSAHQVHFLIGTLILVERSLGPSPSPLLLALTAFYAAAALFCGNLLFSKADLGG